MLSKVQFLLYTSWILVACFILFLIFNPLRKGNISDNNSDKLSMLTRDADEKWSSDMIESVNADNIRRHLKNLTSYPHLGGTPENKRQAYELAAFWKENGLETHISKYNVLLSYPNISNPNRIELQNEDGSVIFTTQLYEKILRPELDHSKVVPPFNAYSASGTPKGDLVFVNYGRIEDFIWLVEEKVIDIKGKICIARYGKIYRGQKAKHAAQYGAIGLIIYSDPLDYTSGNGGVYPETRDLPESGIQRGSLLSLGDPLTRGYPAIESAYHGDECVTDMPTIPVQPIGYGDACHLLREMTGEIAPQEWQGGLNFTYRLGPGFLQPDRKVQMFISTHNQNAITYNAFGILKGAIEPDRYVLLGNHRDAWVFGAVDPSGATASMMELSRVFADMVRKGWRPRRTIIFCSWGAEEYSLIGSREFVEEYRQMLSSRAVAYLNLDIAIVDTFRLAVGAMPLLYNVTREAAKMIPNPDIEEIRNGRTTIYDTWLHRGPELDANGTKTGKPSIFSLGSASDYGAFIVKTGIPCVGFDYAQDPNQGYNSYSLYHSMYETFHLVDELVDPGFKYHKAITQYWGELARRLADYAILPMRVTDYSEALKKNADAFLNNYSDLLRSHGLEQGIEYFVHEISRLQKAAKNFDKRGQTMDRSNPIAIRMYNDQITHFERVFIDPLGLPGRTYEKHVILAPSQHDDYAGSTFPGLVDALFEIEKLTGAEEMKRWGLVKKQLSVVTYFIHAAANFLQDFDKL